MTQFWLTLGLPWLTLIAADGFAAAEWDVIPQHPCPQFDAHTYRREKCVTC